MTDAVDPPPFQLPIYQRPDGKWALHKRIDTAPLLFDTREDAEQARFDWLTRNDLERARLLAASSMPPGAVD